MAAHNRVIAKPARNDLYGVGEVRRGIMETKQCRFLGEKGECTAVEGWCMPWGIWDRDNREYRLAEWFCQQPEKYRKLFTDGGKGEK